MRTIERTASYLIEKNCITKGERCLHAKKFTVFGEVHFCDRKMNRDVVLDFGNGGCSLAEIPVSNGRSFDRRKTVIVDEKSPSGSVYEALED